ncbi:hypothetical protein BKK81_19035 [Cupriavidus sp. USMAHM13]|uniref:Uncharacterized protein n=1 Tax=Cupriavidus malaysiensis TaxID=367825 RepID=A0ABM6FAN0_9BURK|nr:MULTISPECIES: hypothetical protein [Cupriavidus]AOZ01514.1 hypothetical protein BKK81_19035 [Cupriavidus sp. USMAHM13]AOZ08759.1 hypothetical protein BKK80_22910 [Cupriavidus malaysiensis]
MNGTKTTPGRLAVAMMACCLALAPALAGASARSAGGGAQKPAKPAKSDNRNSVLPGNARR